MEPPNGSSAPLESEDRLRIALEAGRMGAWRYDLRTGEQEWTARQFEIFGLQPGGTPPSRELFLSLVHPDDRHLVDFRVDEIGPEGTFLDSEFRIVRPDGEIRCVSAHALARFGTDGRPVEVIGVNQDVTDRKRAEQALRESEERLRQSEERFRTLSEDAPVMLWLSDPNGGCLHLNRALRQFWNVGEDNLADFDWRQTMHPNDTSEIVRQMVDGLQRRAAVKITGRYRRADGQFRMLQTDAQPRFSAGGEFLGMVGVNTDVTERVEAERALAANVARLRRAHNAGRIGDWELDLETSSMVWSDSQYALLGLQRTDTPLTRADFDRLIHPDDRPMVLKSVDASFETGRFETEFRVLSGDGRCRWMAARGEVHRNPAGKPVRMTGVNFDVTTEREARERQKLLIDELNHRVKNTLALVQSFASLTLKNSSPEEFRETLMGRVLALAAAHDLLTKSQWTGTSIKDLVKTELASLNRPEFAQISWNGPEVPLSSKQALSLGMVVHELATNAAKHGALSVPEGRLSIDWRLMDESSPGMLELLWAETDGPTLQKPDRIGFGSRLIRQTVSADLQGTVESTFEPTGLRSRIFFPLDPGETSQPRESN